MKKLLILAVFALVGYEVWKVYKKDEADEQQKELEQRRNASQS